MDIVFFFGVALFPTSLVMCERERESTTGGALIDA